MLAIDKRPKTFAEVIGQPTAVATLKAIAKAPGISVRSIVLQGAYGCGKSTLARIFGKAIGCQEFPSTGDVCCTCSDCIEASRPNSQTYLEFDSSRVGNVDAIKSLTDSLMVSTLGKRRVVVLDEVHALSKQALTSLLKVLEEGIPNTFWIFATTEPLMKTIMSRSCVIEINTIAEDVMFDYVKKVAQQESIEISDEQISQLILKSQGHARNAMQLLDKYRMIGADALITAYASFRHFVLTCVRKQDTVTDLAALSAFTIVDINLAINQFLKNVFIGQGDFEAKLKEKGFSSKIFKFFYQPEIQQALKDEAGVQLALRCFAEMF